METTMGLIPIVTFLMTSSLTLLVLLLVKGRRTRLETRLQELRSQGSDVPTDAALTQFARQVLPKMGATLVPTDAGERTVLQARLLHAGLYSRQAMVLFLGVKMLLIVAPALIAVAVCSVGVVPLPLGLLAGAVASMVGLATPSFWLDKRKARRQTSLRRSLPDALDVLVICMEGGLSLPASMQRVADELQTAYPLLATELHLAQRDVQLGRSPGEALRHFGDRTDLEEIRTLAAVIIQADRYGAGLVKSLRIHAETLRLKRRQHAEERAQKAGLKIIFPTALFIFPAMFVVILGPALIRILGALTEAGFSK
jgi:tight adherence protein C